MGAEVGEIKIVTAIIASGQPTSSGVYLGGFRKFVLGIPVLTSAAVSFLGAGTGGSFWLFRNSAAAQYSAATPGGTGGQWLGDESLSFLAGFHGEVRISANANQAGARDFIWHVKG